MVGVRLFGYLVVVGDGGFAYLVGCFVLSCIELLCFVCLFVFGFSSCCLAVRLFVRSLVCLLSLSVLV